MIVRKQVASVLAVCAFVLALPAVVVAKEFKVDASHSHVGFSIKHMMISNVKGAFGEFEGSFALDDAGVKLEALEGTVATTSIDTNSAGRDKHLRNEDFFNVEKFPQMLFKTARYEGQGKTGKLYGRMTIKGITKEVVFDVEIGGVVQDHRGNTRAGLTLTTTINRTHFGIKYGGRLKSGDLMIGEAVKITLELEGAIPK